MSEEDGVMIAPSTDTVVAGASRFAEMKRGYKEVFGKNLKEIGIA